MPADAKERGQQALVLAQNPILQDALAATADWAMRSFAKASTPSEAWDARLRVMASEEFSAYLLAVIQFGRAEVDRLLKERDKMRAKKRERESLTEYLNNARVAREEFDRKTAELA